MLDLFLKLIEKTVELLQLQRKSRKEVFCDIIEPLFVEMPLVVQDYFSIFQEAEGILDKARFNRRVPKTRLQRAINNIRERRQEFLHARIEIRQMADLIRMRCKDKEVVAFAESIYSFFFSSQICDLGSHKTSTAELAELFDLLDCGDLTVLELQRSIQLMRCNLERSWSEITNKYALLRLKYLHPESVLKSKGTSSREG